MKILTILFTILLSFSVSIAEEFDPSFYIIEEDTKEPSQNNSRDGVEKEFNPNLYIETTEEIVQEETSSSDIEEFNPSVYVEESSSNNIQEPQNNGEVLDESEQNVVILDNTNEESQETSILITPFDDNVDSSTNIMLIGFALAVISLILLILLYSIHYYREKHHLK